ncbi:MAG TPA: hypothetical protein VF188_05640 [Longimicrobiales bacterium]
MIRRCLSCHRPFPANATLEYFPVGRRVACDPARGRLWAVCDACRRWTLAPIEERWEALEEIERRLERRARLLARTENIALFHAGDIEIVRVGRAGRREEAWWRYGREFARRQDIARRVIRRGKLLDAGLMLLLTGLPIWGWRDPDARMDRARRRRFGKAAWSGRLACPGCGRVVNRLPFEKRDNVILGPGDDGGIMLFGGCRVCGGDAPGPRIEGNAAVHVLRRILAYHNFAGAGEPAVAEAAALIAQAGSAGDWTRRIAERRTTLGTLDATHAVALEIALNEETERQLLELELEALEARWREEEEIAAIVDGELTPLPAPVERKP